MAKNTVLLYFVLHLDSVTSHGRVTEGSDNFPDVGLFMDPLPFLLGNKYCTVYLCVIRTYVQCSISHLSMERTREKRDLERKR